MITRMIKLETEFTEDEIMAVAKSHVEQPNLQRIRIHCHTSEWVNHPALRRDTPSLCRNYRRRLSR